MRIVAISDTHGKHWDIDVPEGDVLIHAGDFTTRGKPEEIQDFSAFLEQLSHPHKIVIAGNHDLSFEYAPEEARSALQHCTYLEDESIEIEGVQIYGSPWQPAFFDWAFNLPRGAALREKWEAIPDDTDLLVTHGPPMGILDRTLRGKHVGCRDLFELVRERKPACHIFGHIHEARGQIRHGPTQFINASICTIRYKPTNPAVVLDWPLSPR